MALSPWILVAVFAPSTIIFGYIVWRWERNLFPVLILPASMMILYGWIGVAQPEPPQIPIVARYSFLIVTSFLDYVSVERLWQWLRGERRAV